MESITYSLLLLHSLFFLEDAIIREQRAREIFILFLCQALRQRRKQISLDRISFFFPFCRCFFLLQDGKLRYLQRGKEEPCRWLKTQAHYTQDLSLHVEVNPSKDSLHPLQPDHLMTFREPHRCKEMVTSGTTWHTTATLSPPTLPSPSGTPGFRSQRELPTASQPSWRVLCSLPNSFLFHSTAPNPIRQPGSLQTYIDWLLDQYLLLALA